MIVDEGHVIFGTLSEFTLTHLLQLFALLEKVGSITVEVSPATEITSGHEGWLVWSAHRHRATISDVALQLGVPDLIAATAVKYLFEQGLVQRVP